MHDGTTPLILAARLAFEGMVEELINCHADVNAIDDFGKAPWHNDPVDLFFFVWAKKFLLIQYNTHVHNYIAVNVKTCHRFLYLIL